MPADPLYTTYIAVLLLASLSVFTTVLGVSLAIYVGKNEWAVAIGIGFSAGIMLLISFFELVPTAMGEAGIGSAFLAFILGVLIVAALHWVIPHTHLRATGHGGARVSITKTRGRFFQFFHDDPRTKQ